MELKVLEKKKTRLVFELKGADNTLCNALRDELWQEKDVTVSTYAIDHPLTGVPKFIIETKTKDPQTVLSDASKRLQKKNKELAAAFSKL